MKETNPQEDLLAASYSGMELWKSMTEIKFDGTDSLVASFDGQAAWQTAVKALVGK